MKQLDEMDTAQLEISPESQTVIEEVIDDK